MLHNKIEEGGHRKVMYQVNIRIERWIRGNNRFRQMMKYRMKGSSHFLLGRCDLMQPRILIILQRAPIEMAIPSRVMNPQESSDPLRRSNRKEKWALVRP